MTCVDFLDAIEDPVDISSELELPANEIGELIISGWHVNTYQVKVLKVVTCQLWQYT